MKPKRAPAADRQQFLERLRKVEALSGGIPNLAQKSGLSITALRNYLRDGEPSRPALLALAKAANVTTEWLVTGREDAAASPQPASAEVSSAVALRLKDFVPIQELVTKMESGSLKVKLEHGSTIALHREWALEALRCDPMDMLHFVARDPEMDETIRMGSNVLVNAMDSITTDGLYAFKFADQFQVRRLQFVGNLTAHVSAPMKGFHTWALSNPRMNTEVTFYGKVIWWSCQK